MRIRDRDLESIQEVRILVEEAKVAQRIFKDYSHEQIDRIVKAMAEAAEAEAERLAGMAVEETGFGKYEDKIIKNLFASKSVYEYIKDLKTVGIINENREQRVIEVGVPVGVVAALIPSTNPTSTAIYKCLIALKSGNAIVLSPHPSALGCIMEAAKILNGAAVEAGAPEGLIGCISIPSMEGTGELMRHPDVSMILATGGSAMVRAAYSSGTPALGVGPGNVPAYIERTADIPLAVKRILDSKTFDNGTICASEQAVVTEHCISEKVREEFKKQGGYFLSPEEKKMVGAIIQKPGGGLNPRIVGQSALRIAEMAGIRVPDTIRVLIAEEEGVGKQYPFSMEKLSPVLAFYVEENWERACEKCIELLNFGGLGHSLVIHSNNEEVIREFALKKPVSRMLVNTPSSQGAIGATTNLVPALTLGCGTVGGSATSDNIGPLHLINIRRTVYGVREAEDLRPGNKDMEIDIDAITKLILERLKNLG